MENLAVLKPPVALALWTLMVFALIPVRRMRAMRSGALTADDFKLGESDRVPESVALPNRNAMNLFQMPVLFYLASLILFVTGLADAGFVALGWVYVALRVAHSLVHVTYNRVLHRFVPFALSNGVLVVIWARVAWAMA